MTLLLSFHQLRDWLCCPQLYAYKHVHILPDYQNQTDLHRGELLHQLIAQTAPGTEILPPPDLAELWQRYLQWNAAFDNYLRQPEWGYFFPIELNGYQCGIQGRIDLLVYSPEALLIIDWKTGTPSLTDTWQMNWYAWCCHHLRSVLKIPSHLPIQTQCIYLKENQIQKMTFQPEDLEKYEQELSKHIAQLHAKEYAFIPNPHSWEQGNWCVRCTYQEICPEGIHHCHERSDFAV